MGFLFLVILTLFLPSCAGAHLRKLGIEPPQLGTMANSVARSTVSKHFNDIFRMEDFQASFKKLGPQFGYHDTELNSGHFLFKQPEPKKFSPEVVEKMKDIRTRLNNENFKKLSPEGKKTLLDAEVTRSLRWESGKVYVKTEDNEQSLMIERTDKELRDLKQKGLIAPVVTSMVGRKGQLLGGAKKNIKMMVNVIPLKRKDGGSIVQEIDGDLYFANAEDVMVTLISSSKPGSSKLLLAKGGRYEGETSEFSAQREALEETGHDVTLVSAHRDIKMFEGEKKEPKSIWDSYLGDVGKNSGKKYTVFSEDSRLVLDFTIPDALIILQSNNDKGQSRKVLEDMVKNVLGRKLTQSEKKLRNDYPANVRSKTLED